MLSECYFETGQFYRCICNSLQLASFAFDYKANVMTASSLLLVAKSLVQLHLIYVALPFLQIVYKRYLLLLPLYKRGDLLMLLGHFQNSFFEQRYFEAPAVEFYNMALSIFQKCNLQSKYQECLQFL